MACSHGDWPRSSIFRHYNEQHTTPVREQLPCLLLTTCASRVQTPTMVASYLIMKTHSDLYNDMVGYLRRLPLVNWPSRALMVHLRRIIYTHGWSGSFARQGVLLTAIFTVIGVGHSNMCFYSYVIPILGSAWPWLTRLPCYVVDSSNV